MSSAKLPIFDGLCICKIKAFGSKNSTKANILSKGNENVFSLPFPDDCRILHLKPAMKEYQLRNHWLKNITVQTESACNAKCYVDANCISNNIVSLANGTLICQLSNSDHEMHPGDLKRDYGSIYQPIKVGTISWCLGTSCLF